MIGKDFKIGTDWQGNQVTLSGGLSQNRPEPGRKYNTGEEELK